MTHFSAEEWSDFVRGVTPPQERDRMQAHLDSGCSRCRDAVAWLEKVVIAAASDRAIDPPSQVVAHAHAVFRAPEPKDWLDALEQLAAELVFDNRNSLQPFGVRSVETDHIRLMYRAGGYNVDLQLEPFEASPDIVGQITCEGDQKEDLAGAVVQIVASERTLAETQTNQFGEFIIEQPRNHNTILRIAMKRYGKRIDLPLQNRIHPADQS